MVLETPKCITGSKSFIPIQRFIGWELERENVNMSLHAFRSELHLLTFNNAKGRDLHLRYIASIIKLGGMEQTNRQTLQQEIISQCIDGEGPKHTNIKLFLCRV